MLWRIFWRGGFFAMLALAAYVSCTVVVSLLGLVTLERFVGLSWLDVAVTLGVALIVSVVPSSRLRVLPVCLVCVGFPVLRFVATGAFIELFNFGPGAYPLDIVSWTSRICLSFHGLAVLGASVLAALRLPPRPVNN